MLAWKCQFGHLDKKYASVSGINSISQFIMTDSGPFAIGEYKEDSTIPITDSSSWWNPNNNEELQAALIQSLGDDFYKIYGVPYNGGKVDLEATIRAIPSVFLACPNLLNKVLTDTSTGQCAIYLYTLKKLLVYWRGTPPYTYLFTVNEDGSLTLSERAIVKTGFICGPNSFGDRSGFLVYLGGEVSNPNSFYILNGVSNASKRDYSAVRFSHLTDGYDKIISNIFAGNPKPDFNGSSDPFEPIPPSGENTPGGQFDDNSDIVGDSSLPTLSASDTGFTRIYIPTLSQVKDLARYLWTDDTVIETIWNKIKQFFENPMEAIIGFNLVPVPVPSSGTKSFALMYIDTGVDMDTAANQFVDADCGTLPIQLYYGSALDYSPYTKISCYLPYIGMVQLNTDEVVGRTLQVKYRIDIVSGSCVAKIFVDGNCIYQYSGHCAITIPIAASDFSSYVSAAISVAKLAVGAASGGAAGAAAAALNADVGQQTGSMFSVQSGGSDAGQIQLFSQGGDSGPGTQTEPEIKNTQASFSGITPQNVANTVGEIMTAKPHVQHSGSFSGNSGYLGVRRPFVIIERPNLCLPENYQGFNGFPAMITMPLGECSGYTKVQQMVLSGCTATNPEQAEIMSLLKGGVIF